MWEMSTIEKIIIMLLGIVGITIVCGFVGLLLGLLFSFMP